LENIDFGPQKGNAVGFTLNPHILAATTTFSMDGTFNLSKEYQLFIVLASKTKHDPVTGHSIFDYSGIPVAYYWCKTSQFAVHTRVLIKLKQLRNSLLNKMSETFVRESELVFLSDIDQAQCKAIKIVFPSAKTLYSLWHFSRELVRNMRSDSSTSAAREAQIANALKAFKNTHEDDIPFYLKEINAEFAIGDLPNIKYQQSEDRAESTAQQVTNFQSFLDQLFRSNGGNIPHSPLYLVQDLETIKRFFITKIFEKFVEMRKPELWCHFFTYYIKRQESLISWVVHFMPTERNAMFHSTQTTIFNESLHNLIKDHLMKNLIGEFRIDNQTNKIIHILVPYFQKRLQPGVILSETPHQTHKLTGPITID
jgi:hypothetical protein